MATWAWRHSLEFIKELRLELPLGHAKFSELELKLTFMETINVHSALTIPAMELLTFARISYYLHLGK